MGFDMEAPPLPTEVKKGKPPQMEKSFFEVKKQRLNKFRVGNVTGKKQGTEKKGGGGGGGHNRRDRDRDRATEKAREDLL